MKEINVFLIKDVPGSTEVAKVTEELAYKLLHKWMRILHLEEWDISFRWSVRADDMMLDDSVGCTKANTVSRQAIIQMLDPVDYHNDTFGYDYEKTLVHELLHLTFADMDDTGDDTRDKLTHCMIDRMARALVAAKRSVDE